MNPSSTVHAALHPSLPTVLPSSHPSDIVFSPSPHAVIVPSHFRHMLLSSPQAVWSGTHFCCSVSCTSPGVHCTDALAGGTSPSDTVSVRNSTSASRHVPRAGSLLSLGVWLRAQAELALKDAREVQGGLAGNDPPV